MDRDSFIDFNPKDVVTPAFIVDQNLLKKNLEILKRVQDNAPVKILLALKGFAMFSTFPLLREFLQGVCASSPHEARLGREEFQKEVHSFAAGFSENDLKELLTLSNHIVFNSFNQWNRFQNIVAPYIESNKVEFGIRVNPEHSEGKVAMYDPCAKFSRLGTRLTDFEKHIDGNPEKNLKGISGLHFHSLCQQDSYALERTLKAFEEKFSKYFPYLKWVNFGGGHHITRADYNVDHLISVLNKFHEKYKLDIYMEPGEAVALNTGILVASVLDIIENDKQIVILDASATAHMPDVIEMPYRPEIIVNHKLAGDRDQYKYNYRLGGHSCLAGDVIGDYSFQDPLKIGDKLIFLDMAHYSMVKTTTFNGLQHPSIMLKNGNELKLIRKFGYLDYKNKLS
ncbi:MAG: carboxynorspermidine decarboxylase [Bacteriovoracaceae bacterium]